METAGKATLETRRHGLFLFSMDDLLGIRSKTISNQQSTFLLRASVSPWQTQKEGHSRSCALFNVMCGSKSVVHAVHERAQLARARWMTQLAQCLRLDLPDALARDRERLPNLFERMLAAIFQPEAHLDYFLFPWRQRTQHL